MIGTLLAISLQHVKTIQTAIVTIINNIMNIVIKGFFSEMKKSLQKIKQLDKKINVYPGHGCSTNIEKELSSNFYLR